MIVDFKKILQMLPARERKRSVMLLVFMVVGMVFETLGVGLVVPVIGLLVKDDIVVRYPVLVPVLNALGNPPHSTLVIGVMLGLINVYLLKGLFLAFLASRQMSFAYGVEADLSRRLFEKYLRQPYTFHLQRNSAQLIRNIVTEVGAFTAGALIPGMTLLAEALVLCSLGALAIAVEPLGALVVLAAVGVSAWVFHRVTVTRVAYWGRVRQEHDGLRIQHIQQGLGGIKEVKMLGREAEFLKEYHLHNVESARVARRQATLKQLPRLWLELLAIMGFSVLVLFMVVQGRALETVLPTLGLFAAVAFRLMPSVNRMLGAIHALRYSASAIDMLHAELKLPEETSMGIRSRLPEMSFESIELDHVTYKYPGAATSALSDVSLVVRRGESVGFIGASGAGKSTLVDIALGLLKPDGGDVRVNGQSIEQDLRGWQDQIGYVPQSIFLTDDSLKRNIAFGLPFEKIDEAAVRRVIKAAQLEELVASLPDGLETIVGERGVRLSGGQRQRIGIARALYKDPSVLVLDEATSALDAVTEREVMQAVSALQGNKTILIVAHRLSTVEGCNRLYRLSAGQITEEGPLGSLVRASPKSATSPGSAI